MPTPANAPRLREIVAGLRALPLKSRPSDWDDSIADLVREAVSLGAWSRSDASFRFSPVGLRLPFFSFERDGIEDALEGEIQRMSDDTGNGRGSAIQRLAVDLARKTTTLDGMVYDVASEQALRWVKVLADRPGEWITGADAAHHDPELDGVRTDHLRKRLPDAVLTLIESKSGAGSRIRLEERT